MPTRERAVPPDITIAAAQRLREERKKRKLSMSEMSALCIQHRCPIHPDGCNVSMATINQIENGVIVTATERRTRFLSVDELWLFCEILDMTPDALLGRE